MAQDDGETPSPLSLPPPPPGLSSHGPGAEGNGQAAGTTAGNVSVAEHDAKTGTTEGESDPVERASTATGEEPPQRKASGPPEPITVPQQGLDDNASRGSPGGAVSPILRGRITRGSPSARSSQQRRGSTRSPRRKGAPSPPSPSASSIAKAKEALMAICESINPFSGTAVSKPVLLQKIGKVVGFLQSEDVLQNVAELELDYSKIFLWIRPQLTAPDTLVRTCCFRLLRHFLLEFSAIDVLVELRIHFFVIRSLETEQRHVLERMEALKLCRRIMELECSLLPRAIVRSLVGISRNAEDPFRNVALETLRQLAMRSCSIAAACGGIRALVEAIIDPTLQDMAKSLTLTLVYLLNDSASRQHMRVSMDLAALLSPFTDAGAADSESKAKWAPCQNALLLLLKTWAGVYTLGSDPNGLRALVNMLVQPVSIDLRIVVLETIFLVFIHLSPYDITFAKDIYAEVVIPSSDAEKSKVRRGTATSPRQSSIQMIEGQEAPMVEYWGVGPYSATAQLLASLGYSSEFFPSGQTDPHVIVNQLLVIVLKAFTGCGLVDALIEILVSENPKISELAAQLLAFTMRISERLNPKSIHLKLFSLSQLVKVATDYDNLTSSDTKESIGPRRAIRVLNALTSLSGASYEASLSTIRAQYAYDDAVALSSELALASSPLSEFQRDNLGITPRGMICALPYTPHLIASVLLDHSIGNSNETSASILASPGFRSASPGARNLRRSSQSATLPLNYKHKSKNRLSFEGIRNSVSLISKSKRAEKKALEDVAQQELVHDTMASAFLSRVRNGQSDLSSQALITAVDGIPNVPNKSRALGNMGHRRDVRTKLLTDSAFGDIDSLSARLYRSQVLLGKDYTAWNWSAVEDIIAGPMHHHGLCLEVLKTKFVKRIMGFFRCTAIGEFLILPWKACNQPFTSVAVSLIHVLLDSSEGIEFLRTDRRGKIHRQIIQALQREIHIDDGSTLNSSYFSVAGHRDSSKLDDTSRAVPKSVSSVHSMNLSSSAADAATSTRVFSLMAVSRSMTRDLLTIMGAYTSHTKGMDMLEEHNLLGILTELACNPSKDYLMYVIISVLDYGAEPRCRDWLQKVLLFSKASQGLSLFILGLFRALLRRGQARTDPSFTQWILEMVFSQIERGGSLASSAVSILNEAAFYPMYLDIIVSLNPEPLRPLLQLHFARPLLFKLLGRRRGFDLLESSGWLAEVSREWQVVQCIKYAARYDTLMTSKLLCRHEPKTAIPKSHEELDISEDGDEEDLIKAIDDAFGLEAAAELTEKHLKENSQRVGFRPLRIPVRTFEASAKSDPGFAAPDLLSLLRLPWTVELWLKTSNEGGVKYVRAQTSLECSHLTGPEYGVADDTRIAKELLGKGPIGEKFGSEAHNFVHTGLCVVATPFNESLEVPNDATLYACLTLAGDPLKRNGIVEPVSMCGGGFDTSNTTRSRRSSSVQGRAQSHFHSRKQDNSHTHTQYVRMQPDEVLDYSLKTQDSFPNMDDDKFWIKCGPDHLSHSLHGSNGNKDKGKISYNVCPGATSTATFSFDKANGRVFFRKVAFHLSLQPDFPNAPYIPSHFFGELASTSQGADYLRHTGLIREALEVLLDNSRPRILQRATLWTLGHIASSDTGLTALLEEGFFIRDGDDRSGTDVIKAISDISLNSECLQLRGTATTVLGLISKTQLGCSILQECGWSTPRPEMREQVGYVIVPRYFASVFRRLPRITKDGPRVWNGLSYIFKNQALDRARIPGLPEEEVNSVLLVFSKLITKVGTRDLHTTLVQIKAKCPEIFRSPTLLIYVHGFLESFGYEDVVRQYLLKTFHRNIPFETPEAWGLLDQGLDIAGK